MRAAFISILLLSPFAALAQHLTEEKILSLSGDLKGTLVLPARGKKFDLLVIQAGSGPTDRNGNSILGIKANSYRLLANALAEKNIATLLTDKRGIAASSKAMKKEADLRFDDYADDLAAWIAYIKKDKRVKHVFIAGHSEGSLIGMLAAQKEKVKGYISLAGAGERIDKIVVWQVQQQSPKVSHELDSMLLRLRNDQKLDSVPAYLYSLLRPSIQPYMASWMKHDPCEEIKKLKIPVLIIQGSTDLQVDIKEAEILKACKPGAAYRVLEGMNHILKEAPAERTKNMATYSDSSLPLMPGLVDIIEAFIKK